MRTNGTATIHVVEATNKLGIYCIKIAKNKKENNNIISIPKQLKPYIHKLNTYSNTYASDAL